MINRVKKIDTPASVSIVRLEKPSVMTLEKSRTQCHLCILAFLFAKLVMLLDVAIHSLNYLLFRVLFLCILEWLLMLVYHVEILTELVKFMLTKRCC